MLSVEVNIRFPFLAAPTATVEEKFIVNVAVNDVKGAVYVKIVGEVVGDVVVYTVTAVNVVTPVVGLGLAVESERRSPLLNVPDVVVKTAVTFLVGVVPVVVL